MRNTMRFFFAAIAAMVFSYSAYAETWADCRNEDDVEKSIAACTQIIDSPKSSKTELAEALRQRALRRSSWGEKEEAFADVERALVYKPNDAALYAARATARDSDDSGNALTDMNRAIALNAKNADFFTQRAKLYVYMSDYRAEADFAEAIRLDAKNSERYADRMGYFVERHQYEKALDDASAMISLGKPERKLARAQLYMFLNRFSDAMTDLNAYVGSKEFTEKATGIDAALAYGMRGFCLMTTNAVDKAVSDYSKAITGFDNRTLRQLRGNAFVQMKQYELAIQDYSIALKMTPDDVATLYLRATAYDLNGQPKLALADRTDAAFYSAGLKKPKKD